MATIYGPLTEICISGGKNRRRCSVASCVVQNTDAVKPLFYPGASGRAEGCGFMMKANGDRAYTYRTLEQVQSAGEGRQILAL